MKKIFKLFFIIIILFLYKNGIASNSSSFLISKSAFSNYDFATVLYEFSGNNNTILDENYLDKLIASIITSDMITAKKISEKILFNYPDNQESNLVIIPPIWAMFLGGKENTLTHLFTCRSETHHPVRSSASVSRLIAMAVSVAL